MLDKTNIENYINTIFMKYNGHKCYKSIMYDHFTMSVNTYPILNNLKIVPQSIPIDPLIFTHNIIRYGLLTHKNKNIMNLDCNAAAELVTYFNGEGNFTVSSKIIINKFIGIFPDDSVQIECDVFLKNIEHDFNTLPYHSMITWFTFKSFIISAIESIDGLNQQKVFDDLVNFNPFKRMYLPKLRPFEEKYEEIVHHIMSAV